MDGIDASKFLLGESNTTGRDALLFFGPDGALMSAKAHDIKVWFRYSEGFDKPIAPNTTAIGRARNRRVEFNLERSEDKSDAPPSTEAPPPAP